MRSRTAILAATVVLISFASLAAPSAWALGAPSSRGVFPASGHPGTTVSATISGTGLSGATASTYGETGLSVAVQSTSDTTVSLQLVIDAGATPGERIISLATGGGTVSMSFTVNPAGGPIVSSISPPPVASRGFSVDLDVSGANLAGLDSNHVSVSGAGVSLTSVTAEQDGTALHLTLDVAPDADLGTHALVIDSPMGGAVLQFYVRRPEPAVTRVSPAAALACC